MQWSDITIAFKLFLISSYQSSSTSSRRKEYNPSLTDSDNLLFPYHRHVTKREKETIDIKQRETKRKGTYRKMPHHPAIRHLWPDSGQFQAVLLVESLGWRHHPSCMYLNRCAFSLGKTPRGSRWWSYRRGVHNLPI